MMEALYALMSKHIPLFAGFIGGVVSLKFFDGLTGRGKVMTAFSGAAAAHFLTPTAITWFKLTPPDSYEGGIGFLIGLFAMSISAALVQSAKNGDLTSWFKRSGS